MMKYIFGATILILGMYSCTPMPTRSRSNNALQNLNFGCLLPQDTIIAKNCGSFGCGYLTLVGYDSEDTTHVIIIKLDLDKVFINEACTEIDLTKPIDGLSVFVYYFSPDKFNYSERFINECNDIIRSRKYEPEVLDKITGGKLYISRTQPKNEFEAFFCNAKIEGLSIQNRRSSLFYKKKIFVFYKTLFGTIAG
jgi:hypothetical protein